MRLGIPVAGKDREIWKMATDKLRRISEGNTIGFAVLTVFLLWAGLTMWSPALFFAGFFFSRAVLWNARRKEARRIILQLSDGAKEST